MKLRVSLSCLLAEYRDTKHLNKEESGEGRNEQTLTTKRGKTEKMRILIRDLIG